MSPRMAPAVTIQRSGVLQNFALDNWWSSQHLCGSVNLLQGYRGLYVDTRGYAE